MKRVALFTRAWIEIDSLGTKLLATRSPSLRGRGLKFAFMLITETILAVALFTRAWIEIARYGLTGYGRRVALFTRAWIEIVKR